MSLHTKLAAMGAVGLVLCMTGSASAQFGVQGGFGQGGGIGGGQGGSRALQTGLPQQLPPPILRTNWYMYNGVTPMGTNGGTINVPTQFGLQSQFGNSLGGGVTGQIGARVPGALGANYQRQVAAMLAYQNALAYGNTMGIPAPPPPSGSTSSSMGTAAYGGFGMNTSPLGFSRLTGLDTAFNPASFDPKDSKDPKDQKENTKDQ